MTDLFNTLPRPTFRWLKVNHSPGAVLENITKAGEVIVEGTAKTTPINDKSLFNKEYNGVSAERLHFLADNFDEGFAVRVEKEKKETLYLGFSLSDEHNLQCARVQIILEEGAELNLLYHCEGSLTEKGLFELFTEIKVAPNARLTIAKVQLYSDNVQQFEHRFMEVAEDGAVQFINIELGGSENYLNFESNLCGDKASLYHDVAYVGKGKQVFDVAMLMNHRGQQTQSDIHHLGALREESRKRFKGTLDFHRGSSASEGAEADICLLLDSTVHSVSLPLLLCKEDNVSGNHAASAGQIDEGKLFYLMSRGFSEEEAKHIIVESMLRPIIDKLGNSELEEHVLSVLREKI